MSYLKCSALPPQYAAKGGVCDICRAPFTVQDDVHFVYHCYVCDTDVCWECVKQTPFFDCVMQRPFGGRCLGITRVPGALDPLVVK